jgi:hypothetical protein
MNLTTKRFSLQFQLLKKKQIVFLVIETRAAIISTLNDVPWYAG